MLGGEDLAVVEEEGAGHLSAVASEVADTAAFDEGEEGEPADARAEQFAEATLGEAEGVVEFAVGVGDAVDGAVAWEIGEFCTTGHHMNEDDFGVVGLGVVVNFFEAAEELAGKGTAKVAEENEHEQARF